ncbi:MAG TPA: hypothetical protein VEI57_18220 [Nitrospirota bacterium]|nr:hypothetical protein [Nitrospirota bacterium]
MFIVFLITVTVGLIGTAAYFSVFGIAHMFAYNYIPAMIMGVTLEASKVGVAVYLFRYWQPMTRQFKSLLIMFLALLMFITSVGIFGFLSQGYQKTSEEFNLLSLELKTLEDEYNTQKARLENINSQIALLPANSVRDKIRLSREFGDEQAEVRDRLTVIEPRIQELKVKRLAYESHIGPIAYVARMINVPQDHMVFFAILLLVFVADPLAVTLTIASNMVLIHYWERSGPVRAANHRFKSPFLYDNFLAKVRTTVAEAFRHDTGEQRKRVAARRAPNKAAMKKAAKKKLRPKEINS